MDRPQRPLEDHTQWNAVKEVCSRLAEAGFEALLAGGCVRDFIMGREPNDFDVATSATPDQIESLFEKTIAVGKAFGVIVVLVPDVENPGAPDIQLEVATFREDLEYKDGRRPEGVKFSTSKADAQRRDFTVNALFYDPKKKLVIDYVAGQKDIAAKVIRTVGDPNLRFDEDKLRILRALRFSAQLDFTLADETLKSICERADEVSVVSFERIRDEIIKLLKTPGRIRGLELLLSTGVLNGILPDMTPLITASKTKWLAAFDHLESADDPVALLALFFWPARASVDFPKDLAKLKLDNQTAEMVSQVFRHLESVLKPSSFTRSGELIYLLTKPFAPSLLLVADTLANTNAIPHDVGDRGTWNEALKRARPDGHAPVKPIISGKDLMSMGMKPGPHMGELLHELFLMQLEGAVQSRADAETFVKNKTQ